jgi:predicted PurR-regulated permease PerM
MIKKTRPWLRVSAPFIGLLAFILFIALFLWLFNAILLPFILGGILAYLLDPVVEKMDKLQGIKRPLAVATILGIFLIVVGLLLTILIPLAVRETTQFIDDLPSLIEKVRNTAGPWINSVKEKLGVAGPEELQEAVNKHWQEALVAGTVVGNTAKNIGQGVLGLITIPILTLIIAFFMLNEWPRMQRWTNDMIPRPFQKDVQRMATDINKKLAGFIRGQLSIAFILGISYAVVLALVGLDYGIVIGIMSGLLGVIPLIGSTIGLLVSISVAFLQEGTLSFVLLIAAIFLGGQLIEGNILTPKIVGDSVGLHPLWIFFALLAGASLMGITGLLIAVPVAAIASVVLRFAIEQYKQSAYYLGHE